jgi:DNA-directed RNA polymerase sigma subunit (sigma70/sigma32)
MRVAFSIIFNGLHHLEHKDQYRQILDNCDKWVVVEGASKSNGSTRWCKEMPDEYHINGASVDGTREFLEKLAEEESKLVYVPSDGFWNSKDDQVNRAIEEVKKLTDRCFLWEFDIDEQWTAEAMDQAEKELTEENLKYGAFMSRYYVGKNLLASGEWGEGRNGGYIRLWDWEGESFVRHEVITLNQM